MIASSKLPDAVDEIWAPELEADFGTPFWRASFIVEAREISGLLETLEAEATAVSAFEHEADEHDETLSWRFELLLETHPRKREFQRRLDSLLSAFGLLCRDLEIEKGDHEAWLESLRTPAEPIVVGRFFIHGSNWAGVVPDGLVPICLDPGMAFGSGEHATTRACLNALNQLSASRKFRRVLDLGCGSGLLAIAAAKTNPCRVIATDIDPVATRVAAGNSDLNGASAHIRSVTAEGYRHPVIRRNAPYDLILANVLAGPLIELASQLQRHLAKDGRAILSGLLDRQAEAVIVAHRIHGLELDRRIDQEPWVALVLKRRKMRRRRHRARERHRHYEK